VAQAERVLPVNQVPAHLSLDYMRKKSAGETGIRFYNVIFLLYFYFKFKKFTEVT